MFQFYNILLLSLFFTYSLSKDIEKYYSNRTIASSRSIYELVQIRRAAARLAAYLNRTHRINNTNNINRINNKFLNTNTYASKIEISDFNTNPHEVLMERLKIVIIICIFSVGFMIIFVITCILARYCHGKDSRPTERIEQRKPQTYRTTTYVYAKKDTRNFTRKSRTLPAAV
jgi:hypothetical protein